MRADALRGCQLQCLWVKNAAELPQSIWNNAIVRPLAPLFACEEPGAGELLEVMRNGGLREPDGRGEIADARFVSGLRRNHRKQAHASWIAEGLEHLCELLSVVER